MLLLRKTETFGKRSPWGGKSPKTLIKYAFTPKLTDTNTVREEKRKDRIIVFTFKVTINVGG